LVRSPLRFTIRFYFQLNICCHSPYLTSPLTRGWVFCNCCWPSPVHSFSGPSPAVLTTIFFVSDSRLPQTGGSGPCMYIPREQDSPIVPPATEFSFRT
jgi:hypothetical protein